jgi:hypothetical protein
MSTPDRSTGRPPLALVVALLVARLALAFVVALLLLTVALAQANCPEVKRSRASVYQFRKSHPCPATGLTTGACKNWVVDHTIALCAGGADSPSNMAWQTRAQAARKDVLERAQCHKLWGGRTP